MKINATSPVVNQKISAVSQTEKVLDVMDSEESLENSYEVSAQSSPVTSQGIGAAKESGASQPLYSLMLGEEPMVSGSGRVPDLPESVHNHLVELTDPDTLVDMYDLRSRIRELDSIFVEHEDPRGLFTSLYRVITDGAVDSVEKEMYEDNQWASDLIRNFGRRYLDNLHGELTGGETTGAWETYYQQAHDPSVSRERVTGMGAIVHLVADLPKALVETGVPIERRKDFMDFGDNLLSVYSDMVAAAREGHNVDMDPLFNMFKPGEALDAIAGEGTATRFAYQTIRNKTWYAARGLNDLRKPLAQAEIDISWRGFDKILAGLDASGAL